MRKTWPHNPRGFERNSWNYRCLQLRHALGWSQSKLARVSGIATRTIANIELGQVTRPAIDVIRRIKNMEAIYADILKAFKKSPFRLNRLVKAKVNKRWCRVNLLPIEVRNPESIESLENMGASSEDMFFGRKTRRNMPQTGVSVRKKAYLDRRREAIIRGRRAQIARDRDKNRDDSQVQSGQSNDSRE